VLCPLAIVNLGSDIPCSRKSFTLHTIQIHVRELDAFEDLPLATRRLSVRHDDFVTTGACGVDDERSAVQRQLITAMSKAIAGWFNLFLLLIA
jgi:hypothetical protein